MKPGLYLLVAALLCVGGCLEREITVTSEPAGALVLLNGVEVGRTPVTTSFLWYGDYDVMLRLEDYQTIKTNAKICPRYYTVPPVDLFAELLPFTVRDSRYLHYALEPQAWPREDRAQKQAEAELIQRAEQFRERNLQPLK